MDQTRYPTTATAFGTPAVLMGLFGGGIDRPPAVGALYRGQGEAGRKPTPGGMAVQDDLSGLQSSTDHCPGAHGNLASGYSPEWHGTGAADLAAGGHRPAVALPGTKP